MPAGSCFSTNFAVAAARTGTTVAAAVATAATAAVDAVDTAADAAADAEAIMVADRALVFMASH